MALTVLKSVLAGIVLERLSARFKTPGQNEPKIIHPAN